MEHDYFYAPQAIFPVPGSMKIKMPRFTIETAFLRCGVWNGRPIRFERETKRAKTQRMAARHIATEPGRGN